MKYEKYVTIGYDANGNRVRKHIKANTKKEFEAIHKRLVDEFQVQEPQTMPTFGEYSRNWLEVYKSGRESNTYDYYRFGLNRLTALNDKLINEINQTDLQLVINSYWDKQRTCRKLNGMLKQIFNSAIADDLILKNPALSLNMPPKQKKEKRILTEEETQAIKNADLPPAERLFLDLEYYLGLRPEETRALTYDAFDLENRTVSIYQAAVFKSNAVIIKDTKNRIHRTIPISDEICLSVKRLNALRATEMLFVGKSLTYLTSSGFKRFKERIFDAVYSLLPADHPHDITFYTLRHNRGTQLYYLTQSRQGLSTKLAAYYMGHSETMFLEIYSHIDEKKENIDLLRQVL